MENRIKELDAEIEQFNKSMQEKNNIIQQAQVEVQQLAQGIFTRQGGIIELKKLLEKSKIENEG